MRLTAHDYAETTTRARAEIDAEVAGQPSIAVTEYADDLGATVTRVYLGSYPGLISHECHEPAIAAAAEAVGLSIDYYEGEVFAYLVRD